MPSVASLTIAESLKAGSQYVIERLKPSAPLAGSSAAAVLVEHDLEVLRACRTAAR